MPREPPQEVQRAEASPELSSSEAWHNRQRIGWNSAALESSIITISASRSVLLSGAFVVNLHRERGKSVVGNTSGGWPSGVAERPLTTLAMRPSSMTKNGCVH